ncbi:MAG TPA: TolC family protein [Acidobacteria bacterium]|nr:TolC family protein [Acidobacteriota bacterium]
MTRRLLTVLAAVALCAGPVALAQEGTAPAQTTTQPAAASPNDQAEATPPAETGPIHLSLEEAITGVMEANPGLKALGHRSAAAAKNASAAGRKRWGNLDAFFTYTRYNDDRLVRPMSWEMISEAGGFAGLPWDRNQRHYGLTYSIPLYLGGQLSNNIKIANFESQKAEALVEGTRWQLRFNATSLYTAAQTLDRVEGSLGELVKSLEKTKERLDLMVESGKRPEVDRLKVVEQLEDARAQRESVRADRVRVGALLLALMGKDPSLGIVVDPLPDRTPGPTMTPEELRTAALENSTIRRARFTYDESESQVKVRTASFIPKVFASGNVTQNAAPSVDDPLDSWQVSVGVVVPILHGTSRFEELAAAKEQRSAAEASVQNTQLRVQSQLEEALARFKAAQAELKAARARVAAGTEAARIEQIRYDTGASTIEDLLRAQARKQAAEASLAKARGGLITAAERINSIVEKEAMK